MITKKNMERGLVLMELFQNNFQKFEKESEKLKQKDKEQICWWWGRCEDYLNKHRPLTKFMK